MLIKRILKDFFCFILDFLKPFKENRAVILMYHSIGQEGEFFQVSAENFARQMDYLALNKFAVIKLSELLAKLELKEPIAAKTAVVTFDDGYLDNYSVAWPILRQHGFSATIFVNTADLGKSRTARGGHQLPLLSEQEILALSQSGLIEFGSHCHHHVKLVNLPNQQIEAEFKTSKKVLRDLLNQEIKLLAYPAGRYNEEVENLARKYYQAAVSVKAGLVRPQADPLALPRNSVDRAVSFVQFKSLLKFGKL